MRGVEPNIIIMIKVKFKKLVPHASTPMKAHPDYADYPDAAYDLTATSIKLLPNGMIQYGTGIAMEIPKGYAGYVYPRSSIRKTNMLMANSVGIIDSGYRGEIFLTFKPDCPLKLKGLIKAMLGMKVGVKDYLCFSQPYKIGDRIGQIVIRTAPKVTFVETSKLDDSDRGDGGHGSTGA